MMKENNTLIPLESSFWKLQPNLLTKLMKLSLLWLKKLNQEFKREMTQPIMELMHQDKEEEESRLVIMLIIRKNHQDVVEKEGK